MSHRVLRAGEAYWRPSNQTRVMNTDLAAQLGATTMGARMWRLAPGQTITLHRHRTSHELYVVLEGTGRMHVGDAVLTLTPHSAVLVEPGTLRQPFNDTDAESLWLIVGAPTEPANTLAMTEEDLAFHYPRGPRALPPELGGGELPPPPAPPA
jgi:mannose-6-phosphate isomerase-like protein (cupin superfamily)